MITSDLIAAIDAAIDRLQQVRKLLSGSGSDNISVSGTRGGKRTISAEGRARISAAQKKRWAQQRNAKEL